MKVKKDKMVQGEIIGMFRRLVHQFETPGNYHKLKKFTFDELVELVGEFFDMGIDEREV